MNTQEIVAMMVGLVLVAVCLWLVYRGVQDEDGAADATERLHREMIDTALSERDAAVRDAALQRAAAHAAERALIQANADLREMRKENLELVRNATRLLRAEVTARTVEDVIPDPPTVGAADRAAVELAREEERREEERRRHAMAVTDGEVEPVVTAPPTGWEGEDGG